jgi:hypothetical protein
LRGATSGLREYLQAGGSPTTPWWKPRQVKCVNVRPITKRPQPNMQTRSRKKAEAAEAAESAEAATPAPAVTTPALQADDNDSTKTIIFVVVFLVALASVAFVFLNFPPMREYAQFSLCGHSFELFCVSVLLFHLMRCLCDRFFCPTDHVLHSGSRRPNSRFPRASKTLRF